MTSFQIPHIFLSHREKGTYLHGSKYKVPAKCIYTVTHKSVIQVLQMYRTLQAFLERTAQRKTFDNALQKSFEMVGGNLKSLEMFTLDFHRPAKKPNNTLNTCK